jgi:hypothetical protein
MGLSAAASKRGVVDNHAQDLDKPFAEVLRDQRVEDRVQTGVGVCENLKVAFYLGTLKSLFSKNLKKP